jgi:integrase
MATLKFILRRSSRGSAYAGRICARIIHCRRVRVQTLEVSLYPGEWDEAGQQVVFGKEGSPRYRYLCQAAGTLDDYRVQFGEIVCRLEKSGRYSLADIVIGDHTRLRLTGLRGFAVYLSRGLERSGQGRTARAYLTAVRALVSFNRGSDIPLRHINACMIREFETWLKERGLAMKTISYYMRMLRAIYRKAVREGLTEAKRQNPFEGVFTGFKQTGKRALDAGKLKGLYSLDFSALLEQKPDGIPVSGNRTFAPVTPGGAGYDKGLYDCWRYFFFCFLARGMSFVDMSYLRKENIRRGVISYYRKKTGQKIEVTLTSSLQRIIDSFSAEVISSSYLFPVIRDEGKSARLQYESGLRLQNQRLKRLAKLAGTGCNLSTHVSRHSWATIGKKQNLPLWVISEGLGHSSQKTTYIYLASFDRSTIDKASEQISLSVTRPQATEQPGIPPHG